jgi:hypothetical protein
MAVITLHREDLPGLDREKFRAKLADLQARFPRPATVTYRRWPRYGAGYTFYVKGEGTPLKFQTRAHCQFCGRHQVVEDDVLVLHGYKRPGHGWIYGRCPGAGKPPLQREQKLTERWLADAQVELAAYVAAQPALDAADKAALERVMAEEDKDILWLKPSAPYVRYNATQDEKVAADKAYTARLTAWYERHPLVLAYETARDAARNNHADLVQAQDRVRHFEILLALELLGTAYLKVAK